MLDPETTRERVLLLQRLRELNSEQEQRSQINSERGCCSKKKAERPSKDSLPVKCPEISSRN